MLLVTRPKVRFSLSCTSLPICHALSLPLFSPLFSCFLGSVDLDSRGGTNLGSRTGIGVPRVSDVQWCDRARILFAVLVPHGCPIVSSIETTHDYLGRYLRSVRYLPGHLCPSYLVGGPIPLDAMGSSFRCFYQVLDWKRPFSPRFHAIISLSRIT